MISFQLGRKFNQILKSLFKIGLKTYFKYQICKIMKFKHVILLFLAIFSLILTMLASECRGYVYGGDCLLAQARGTHGFQYCYATGYGYHGDDVKKICCKAHQNACYHIQSSKYWKLGTTYKA